MTILSRIRDWKDQGNISPDQEALLTNLALEQPFSLSLELNVLLYAGVLAFVAGLGWTISTWSQQLGTLAILTALTLILAASLWFCFARVPTWSPAETSASSPFVDYVLYLACLVWSLELAYVEQRFHLLSGQWDLYLLLTAALFFALAYRFDNRFVLSLALSGFAGWFGLALSHGPLEDLEGRLRPYALLYCLIVGAGTVLLQHFKLKPHFFGTYLNLVANVLFWTTLSGVFEHENYGLWVIGLLATCGASLAWGLNRRQFVFVAYAAVYGYIGISSLIIRNSNDAIFILGYFVVTAIAMLVMLVKISQHFWRTT
ncbi:DUF2157 domain-containing protein [Granulicella tundricola]|uniref:DUF2157 domain-containing protein n=1 Tax=Granulicella tundricola (strain ATCC BAA-1859 / DSM 23138 / MP5ACTX9) TaxID=1198114 RepID=E8WXN7_GRATM|nr:DUF2157 domain-containing protein [Granulicella tundricola]ADW68653.1 hypothetical protein AciX9_1600 [Granulicella tundricola MP5ACTX9]